MIAINNSKPIALSTVEGCARSSRFNVLTSKGLSAKRKGFSLLALSALLFALWRARLASEILFLSSLRTELANNLNLTCLWLHVNFFRMPKGFDRPSRISCEFRIKAEH
jgi:hypothetical protein